MHFFLSLAIVGWNLYRHRAVKKNPMMDPIMRDYLCDIVGWLEIKFRE